MLRRSSRVLLGVAAVLPVAIWVAPLWKISLKAPQYPEGLRLYLWANQVTGDLRSINGLNHYIGMKPILPEAIPELRFLPVAVAVLIGLGILATVWGRRAGLFLWTGCSAVGAVAALADFWSWGYDYGHNLSPDAAIKVPGMSYQPPLIGPKQLLNFEASSWPALAGWAVVLSLVLAVLLSIREAGRRRAVAPPPA
jgi:copper chaperone NosL